jgi:uncharacterized protein YjbI with pentapeptide repeats
MVGAGEVTAGVYPQERATSIYGAAFLIGPVSCRSYCGPGEFERRSNRENLVANEDHIAQLNKGVAAWNAWREKYLDIRPDLRGANLRGADLHGAHLGGYLRDAVQHLLRPDFNWADLKGVVIAADLSGAILSGANLIGAILSGADLSEADLHGAHVSRAKLGRANLLRADLRGADLREADLREAVLFGANLFTADLSGANLFGANLEAATLLETDLTGADLTGCRIHGVSAWRLKLDARTKQKDLVITRWNEPAITVDNIEVAQFIYLLLHNEKVRDVIDTVTSKVVLILGRFTPQRKAVLDAIREELRGRNYLPILFDFDKPASRDITETVSLLARMARFVIADITDAKSVPQELMVIVPHLPSVPVQPLLLRDSGEYGMFEHYKRYPWLLPIYRYEIQDQLITVLGEQVIEPAERMAFKLRAGTK